MSSLSKFNSYLKWKLCYYLTQLRSNGTKREEQGLERITREHLRKGLRELRNLSTSINYDASHKQVEEASDQEFS
jgi:hypothetical protein